MAEERYEDTEEYKRHHRLDSTLDDVRTRLFNVKLQIERMESTYDEPGKVPVYQERLLPAVDGALTSLEALVDTLEEELQARSREAAMRLFPGRANDG